MMSKGVSPALSVLLLLSGCAQQTTITTATSMERVGVTPSRDAALSAGQTFKDCIDCPEMVVIPAGTFVMGSPASEVGRDDDEGPQHLVSLSSNFAVAKFDTTFAEWDACASEGGCNSYRPSDEGWGRGARPVINVSWRDAQSYITWLSRKTGKPYRMLSESEWEYAARAGTETAYYWGEEIGYNHAHCDGCGDPWDGKNAPVGSFAPNAFGLHDMSGNVWQWTADCFTDDYRLAPLNGAPQRRGDCGVRVLRGGSRDFSATVLRSAFRYRDILDRRAYNTGFRVARGT